MNNVSETIAKMVQSLPESLQVIVLEELKEIVAEKIDEAEWNMQFEQKQGQLITVAKKVKEQIAAGKVEEMDYEKLCSMYSFRFLYPAHIPRPTCVLYIRHEQPDDNSQN